MTDSSSFKKYYLFTFPGVNIFLFVSFFLFILATWNSEAQIKMTQIKPTKWAKLRCPKYFFVELVAFIKLCNILKIVEILTSFFNILEYL